MFLPHRKGLEKLNTNFEKVATTSERIKEAMSIKEKKQIDLVRSTGIDKGSMSHYVSGTYEPKNEAIHKLAKALDVSEMWLWGYAVPMERPAEQKKSDAKIDIADRIYNDNEFFFVVEQLNKLTPAQFKKAKGMLDLLFEETEDEI